MYALRIEPVHEQPILSWEALPGPHLAVDPVVLSVDGDQIALLLWRRTHEPFRGAWALPGVFVVPDERLDGAVARALATKAHLEKPKHVEQLVTWDSPDRDPRGTVVVVAYFVLDEISRLHQVVRGREAELAIAHVDAPPDGTEPLKVVLAGENAATELAFDHGELIRAVISRIRGKLAYSSLALGVMPEHFTLLQLQQSYEALLGRRLNKDSFRRTITQTSRLVEATGKRQSDVDHRPAELYRRARRPPRSR